MRLIPHATFVLALVLLVGGRTSAVADVTSESDDQPNVVSARGDFETGSLSQWGVQCANTGTASNADIARGTVHVEVRNVGQGRYGARFDLPAAENRTACEVTSQRNIGLLTDDYYGLMVFFPRKWREPSTVKWGWGLAIAQLGYQGIWGAPVSLQAHANYIALATQSGLCRPVSSSSPGCEYVNGQRGNGKPIVVVPKPLPLHSWLELIVHTHWATDSSGAVDVWYRVKGQTQWKQTASIRGVPSVQWTPERLSTLHFNFTVDKIGAYRAPATFPLTIWHDGFVRTTSFAAAAAALP